MFTTADLPESFQLRLAQPGDRFVERAAESVVGQEITVRTSTGRRVRGTVTAGHVDEAGGLHVTIETSEPVLPPMPPSAFSVRPLTDR